MHYIIYKTTNIINNKYYIGKHITNNLDDGYIGSGKALTASIKKYGKECFVREILFELPSEELMNLKEKELVTEELVNDSNCYNMTLGGEGGPIFKGKHHTDETKLKISQKRRLQTPVPRTQQQKDIERARRYAQNDGKWFSDTTIEKLRDAAYKRHGTSPDNPKTKPSFKSLSEEEKLERLIIAGKNRSIALKGHKVTEESKKKISDSRKGKICINNGIKNKFITEDTLDYYLNNGYVKGGIKRI